MPPILVLLILYAPLEVQGPRLVQKALMKVEEAVLPVTLGSIAGLKEQAVI